MQNKSPLPTGISSIVSTTTTTFSPGGRARRSPRRMKTLVRYSALILAVLGMASAIYFYCGFGLRHRISGHWVGTDPTSFVNVSWSGQCSFHISRYSGVGRGEFKRDGGYFRMKFQYPDRPPGSPLAILLSTSSLDKVNLPRKELDADILEVEPWHWPSIHSERLTKTKGEQIAAADRH